MRGIFWNSRGLSDLAKTKFLADTVREQSLDFIALMETGNFFFHRQCLMACVGEGTLSGIGLNLMGGQEVSWWELTLTT